MAAAASTSAARINGSLLRFLPPRPPVPLPPFPVPAPFPAPYPVVCVLEPVVPVSAADPVLTVSLPPCQAAPVLPAPAVPVCPVFDPVFPGFWPVPVLIPLYSASSNAYISGYLPSLLMASALLSAASTEAGRPGTSARGGVSWASPVARAIDSGGLTPLMHA